VTRDASLAVTLADLRLDELRIPFRVSFRHASAERSETSSLWIEATSANGIVGYGESCPRDYVTGETIETARKVFDSCRPQWLGQPVTLEFVRRWVDEHWAEVDTNPAAWCAIELALLDLVARESHRTVEQLVSLPPLPETFQYTAVVGDAGSSAFRGLVEQYRQRGFTDFKVKLSGDLSRDRGKVDVFRPWPPDSFRLRVDANNLWPTADEAIAFLQALDYPVFAVEEPIRANRYSDLARIGEALATHIVLDESVLRAEQLTMLPVLSSGWLVNVRVSKMGGLLRSLDVIDAARQSGVGVIVGAQVGETSLLTRAALTVAHAAGDLLVAQEGAFGTLLLQRDICDPPIMFGASGRLVTAEHPVLNAPGLGIKPQERP
jgi:L-alanine-DL-glutamate epimerase-like enolase superfamily enzyme